MSTPPPPPTRQQLDELDVLLQRMLALPVRPAEGEPDAGAAEPEAAPLPVAEARPASAVRPRGEAARPAPTPDRAEPAAPTELSLGTGEVKIVRQHGGSGGVGRPHAAALGAAPSLDLPAPAPRPPARWLHPLRWTNRAFDRWTLRLGAPGRWLRRPAGRRLLGWAGVLLLTAALALVLLDRLGWAR